MSDVNSRDYWNTRFETDWSSRQGCEQSRFFADVAIALMPPWLVRLLREGATVCDFGCAMGDGTQALAAALPGARFTGVDFSSAAIEHAQRHHQGARFECRDLLQQAGSGEFDVLFSSNVLEHFHRPTEVLGQLAAHTGRLMVHLLPFRERPAVREPEHHVVFDWSDLPLAALPGWRLVHAASIDTRLLPNSRWPGEQILVVHARDAEVERLGLTLADVHIDSPSSGQHARLEAEAQSRRLSAQLDQMLAQRSQDLAAQANLDARLRELESRLGALHERFAAEQAARAAAEASARQLAVDTAAQLADHRVEVTRLQTELTAAQQRAEHVERELAQTRGDLAAIRGSRIWRWSAPIRGGGG
ncbi:MAG: methyltransferase [Planctomycetes bacterium]|nr:methyltransferase [Planctomycetota bacterium]